MKNIFWWIVNKKVVLLVERSFIWEWFKYVCAIVLKLVLFVCFLSDDSTFDLFEHDADTMIYQVL